MFLRLYPVQTKSTSLRVGVKIGKVTLPVNISKSYVCNQKVLLWLMAFVYLKPTVAPWKRISDHVSMISQILYTLINQLLNRALWEALASPAGPSPS